VESRFKFEPAQLPPESYSYEYYMSAWGLTKAEAKKEVQRTKETSVYLSDTYQVNVREVNVPAFGLFMTHVSIKRRDKQAFHDWREMQQIKNAICGPEREAVELYPAESRLVDTSNQYHLWVLPEGTTFPFGYRERLICTESGQGAVQRPFDS
jgi:hypothetical protein